MKFEKQNVYGTENYIILNVLDRALYSTVIIEVLEYSTLYPRVEDITEALKQKGFEYININPKAYANYDEDKNCWFPLVEYQVINSTIKSKDVENIVKTVEEILTKI